MRLVLLVCLVACVVCTSPVTPVPPPSDDTLINSGIPWALSVVFTENVLQSTPQSLLTRFRSILPSPADGSLAVLLGYCFWPSAILHPDAFFASRCLQPPTYPSVYMLATFTVIGTGATYCSSLNVSQLGNVSTSQAPGGIGYACFARADLTGEFTASSSSTGIFPTTATGQAAAVVIIILFLVALIVCACVLYRKVLKPQEDKAQATATTVTDLGGPAVAYGRTMRQVNYEDVTEHTEMTSAPREQQRSNVVNGTSATTKTPSDEFRSVGPTSSMRAPPPQPPQVSMEPPAPGTVSSSGRVTLDIDY